MEVSLGYAKRVLAETTNFANNSLSSKETRKNKAEAVGVVIHLVKNVKVSRFLSSVRPPGANICGIFTRVQN